ncbi:NADPH-dependent assimilatory sulfite reductase hemoprotein subunit [Opitutus terrae]|uniref:assimilatory sulfite reductase (NADPH) n=1 Tax=Opitutus terrae (strain DSM 11246 / JCM 15787 / PB90-1) TaxID=452637 RepID=B1ZSB5_OPITP|nr:NADPH-dependent assimilatory sulfite reductase hemoprotein subunit [Opitutus terrae]ACB75714.1 nitrite and sulphite reductase 4Fe-4S region [Opitutus terrae PB90-1]
MPEAAPTPVSANEVLKQNDPLLAGTIAATLADSAADRFSDDDTQFLKFHGCYQQDDRDVRKTGKKYLMMVRGRIPGGVMTPAQWIAFDDLATRHGNNTLRITTRQSIQFHGVLKSGLGALIKGINASLLSTLAACGDVSRNVTASPTPATSKVREQAYADAVRVALALAPKTKAYHSIWIDHVQLNLDEPANKDFVDPLYGPTYLPRKFKVSFVVPPVNDMDIYTNDLGFIAIIENDRLLGYNVAVGGGMGRSHGNEQTFPRLADVIGFVQPEHVIDVAKAVLTIHRDFGDRVNRKHARLKYVIEERGTAWTFAEVNRRAGGVLSAVRRYEFTTTGDVYGWNRAVDGSWFLTLFVETGRVKDADGRRQKTALREIAQKLPHIEFRLSANQNIILANIPDADRATIDAILAAHGVKTTDQASPLHAVAMACPALPTCGLALAESERMLPGLIDRIEKLGAEIGIAGEEIIIRSTGCPNGCARPYMAEIAFVGKAPGRYQLWLGGDAAGTRLNRLYRDTVKDPEIETELRPLLTRWKNERVAGERFGDFAARVLWPEIAAAKAALASASAPAAPKPQPALVAV